MRKLMLIFLLIFNGNLFSQNKCLSPKVDERIELLSIVFRLADSPEYKNNTIKQYTDSIDNYFKTYKNHKVIKMASQLRDKNEVSFDAVPSLAIHIKIVNDSIKFNPRLTKNNLDDRWTKKEEDFILLLDDFYRKSNFKNFFNQNQEFYEIAINRFSKISNSINLLWFERFFACAPKGKYNVVLSFTNWGNYGPKITNKSGIEDIYSILSASSADSLGYPIYKTNKKQTLVHEFCHSFCNQLGEKYYPEMESKAQELYLSVLKLMNSQAYGSAQTMINEILVRASTIKYLEDEGANSQQIDKLLDNEEAKGFLWIRNLYQSLNVYSKNRKKYPTLDSYMNQIIKVQEEFSIEN
nr:DUF4932 domain-containing protein [uncultured Marinifilum sp.]